MNNYDDYCTKLFGEHSCTKEDCPNCRHAKIIAEHDSELLDKVAEKIREYSGLHYVDCDGYFGGIAELIFKVDDWLDEVIAEMKAEVDK